MRRANFHLGQVHENVLLYLRLLVYFLWMS